MAGRARPPASGPDQWADGARGRPGAGPVNPPRADTSAPPPPPGRQSRGRARVAPPVPSWGLKTKFSLEQRGGEGGRGRLRPARGRHIPAGPADATSGVRSRGVGSGGSVFTCSVAPPRSGPLACCRCISAGRPLRLPLPPFLVFRFFSLTLPSFRAPPPVPFPGEGDGLGQGRAALDPFHLRRTARALPVARPATVPALLAPTPWYGRHAPRPALSPSRPSFPAAQVRRRRGAPRPGSRSTRGGGRAARPRSAAPRPRARPRRGAPRRARAAPARGGRCPP